MMLEEIIERYGTEIDYYDYSTGIIFAITEMFYDGEEDVTRVPAYEDTHYIGTALMKGNWCRQNE